MSQMGFQHTINLDMVNAIVKQQCEEEVERIRVKKNDGALSTSVTAQHYSLLHYYTARVRDHSNTVTLQLPQELILLSQGVYKLNKNKLSLATVTENKCKLYKKCKVKCHMSKMHHTKYFGNVHVFYY
jgi:hypothetical protein